MGVFSFFSQIGDFISTLVDMISFSFTAIKNFFVMIITAFSYLGTFSVFLPGEIMMLFSVLISIALIGLVLNLLP